jgi:hypothetical protein
MIIKILGAGNYQKQERRLETLQTSMKSPPVHNWILDPMWLGDLFKFFILLYKNIIHSGDIGDRKEEVAPPPVLVTMGACGFIHHFMNSRVYPITNLKLTRPLFMTGSVSIKSGRLSTGTVLTVEFVKISA